MKANQAFKANEDAVSPVIGVILMVAITVVLAAVVFVLVTKLSSNQSNSAPTLSGTREDATDRINIISGDAATNWGQYKIQADKLIEFKLNGATGVAGVSGNTGTTNGTLTTIGTASQSVTAGNFIEVCGGLNNASPAAAVDLTNVVIKIIHTETNQQVYETTFSTVAKCA